MILVIVLLILLLFLLGGGFYIHGLFSILLFILAVAVVIWLISILVGNRRGPGGIA